MIKMKFNEDLSIIAFIVNRTLNGKRMNPVKVHSVQNDKALGPVIGQKGVTMISVIADSTDVGDFHPILIIHHIVILSLKRGNERGTCLTKKGFVLNNTIAFLVKVRIIDLVLQFMNGDIELIADNDSADSADSNGKRNNGRGRERTRDNSGGSSVSSHGK